MIIVMGKRDAIYAGEEHTSPYPPAEEMVWKKCDICGLAIVVNNWPDRQSRTPKFKDFVICADCDPRHPEDRYLKTGYRILHPRRLQVIKYAQVTRALARRTHCFREEGPEGEGWPPDGCKCAGCTARKLMPR